MKLYQIIFFISISMMCNLPYNLSEDESCSIDFDVNTDGAYLLNLYLSSNTSWEETNNESAVLTIFIDGVYNNDIVIYNGSESHNYQQIIGDSLSIGTHTLDLYFDYNKSSPLASNILIENKDIISLDNTNIDSDAFKYSPILYGRNIFAWNESNHTDIPLILYYDVSYEDNLKTIKYSIIFSNEDSRVGIGLSDMMLSWGRTTDIEWIYEVSLNSQGDIINEIFQGASHTPTIFNGNKLNNHPYLINATANCNFSDTGISDYIFFLTPLNINSEGHTREYIMDQNPWSYKIMGQELINEDKYEEEQNPLNWEISDVRNYLYIEYEGYQSESNILTKISTNFYNDCYPYSNNHNNDEIFFDFGNGINRTAIELPENFNPNDLQYLTIQTSSNSSYSLILDRIIRLFYLSQNYELINLDFSQNQYIEMNENNTTADIIINNDTLIYDCNSEENGLALCDECYICSGGNTGITPNENLDDCNVCFGANEDMDCDGVCFGNATIDDCGICDSIQENDNQTCSSGCMDINAENFNSNATIHDFNCIYSDQVFYVPEEYEKIQNAIYFASSQDTVLVGPGDYYEEIDLLSKGITILSTHGPDSTIITANYQNEISDSSKSVVTIRDLSGTAKLDGFTLQGGNGQGVDFEYFISVASDASMFNDMMYNNIKSGAITSINSNIDLSNLIIKNNTATNFGAGIGLVDSYSNIQNVLFENNHIPDGNALGGAAVAINGGTTFINNCIIKNNSVGLNLYQLNGGGGILCGFNFSETPLELTVSNTEIFNNTANIGAAIGVLSGNILLDHLLIYNNSGNYGSAISMGEPLGLVIDDINMTIIQSTITDNYGTFSFGLTDNSHLIFANSILWNDNGTHEFLSLPNNSILDVNAYYSDIRFIDNINHSNSISLNPLFIESNNYNLSASSPCIDAGTNSLIVNEENIINQEIEYYGIMPDIGYFEFSFSNYGDANIDFTIDVLDIILIINIIIQEDIQTEYSLENADTNQDGIINILDIIATVNIILSQ